MLIIFHTVKKICRLYKICLSISKTIVTSVSKLMGMKKFVIALILVAGVTGIAFAAFDSSGSKKQKMKVEKKAEKKKECKRSCIFSI
jgi:hypothetical protein